jgi:hypothetical protein
MAASIAVQSADASGPAAIGEPFALLTMDKIATLSGRVVASNGQLYP